MAAPSAPAPRRFDLGGFALYSIVCMLGVAALLFVLLPRGFHVGGIALGLPVQVALLAAAVLAGAWGAASAREDRALIGAVLAALLLAPSYDPRAPVERWPLYLVVGALFLLHVEFAMLHAKVARLARLPRAHVVQGTRAAEVELQATARRIVESWPVPLALAGGVVALMLGLQLALAAAAPEALGRSFELRGPIGLVLASVAVLSALFVVDARRRGVARPAQVPGGGGSPGPGPGGDGASGGGAGGAGPGAGS